jgi:putative ABC transport system permease protein
MWWLFARLVRRPLRRFLLAAVGVAFPVALLGAILLYVDGAVRSMTRVALAPVQVEMRALATSLDVDMAAVRTAISAVPEVQRTDRFASADVLVSAPGVAPTAARLFAVDPDYFQHYREAAIHDGALQPGGAVLAQPLRAAPGFTATPTVTIMLEAPAPAPATSPTPSDEGPPEPPPPPPWSMSLPVTGTADLRQATTWYAVPSGDAQGDEAVVPRALVIDYATFEQAVLPELRKAAQGDRSWAFDPGNTDLPRASVEVHIGIDHAAYPPDPGQAARWSDTTRHVIERSAAGTVVVADNAAEALTFAQEDATNAKILFFLLGFPGVLVGAALGLAAAGALAETQRREQSLLQLRGATDRQLVILTSAQSLVATVVGAALGLVAAAAGVAAVTGRAVWREIPAGRLWVTVALAVGVGLLTTGARLIPVVRSARREDGTAAARRLEAGWNPLWRRARLDYVLIGVGALVLGVNALAGGLKPTPIEGQTLALAFYVLLAPIALWLGVTLLCARVLLAVLRRASRPDRIRPLRSWPAAALRWLGRRPSRTAVALILCTLAVAFGTSVTAFTVTYGRANAADRAAAIGSDLRLTPPVGVQDPPPAVPGMAAASPIRELPARVGSDRKTIAAIDLASYRSAATAPESLLAGQGVAGLAAARGGVLINKELADGFAVGPGDTLPVTVLPDDPLRSRNLAPVVVGVFRSVPPAEPVAELVMPIDALAAAVPPPLPAPDFYLVKVAPGATPAAVAGELRRRLPTWTVTTLDALVIPEQRALTGLNLRGLSRLEAVAAGLVAAVGVAILGAFFVLERRRESAVLRTVGAGTGQVVTAPVVEGVVAVLGGLVLGIPIGLGLGLLSIRILGLFFTLPPPLLVVPTGAIWALAAVVVGSSAVALTAALVRVARQSPASVLRDI